MSPSLSPEYSAVFIYSQKYSEWWQYFIAFRFAVTVICRCFACATAFRQRRVSTSEKLPASRRNEGPPAVLNHRSGLITRSAIRDAIKSRLIRVKRSRILRCKFFDLILSLLQVNPGSKAAQQGVREGDLISNINGRSTRELTNSEAHALLRNSGEQLKLGLNQ